ncbi:hypothetical protein GR254_14935, partial [Mycobacterium tuberculosis]|nr:hypothetical protein [Mycobacterium tuberculosis]
MRHMGFGASRLDVRLVPAALVSWIVTAAGIVWPIDLWNPDGVTVDLADAVYVADSGHKRLLKLPA